MKLQNYICLCDRGALVPFENHRAFRLPAVRGGIEVVVRKMKVDGCDQLPEAGKAVLTDNVVGQLREEAFDEVEPRQAGGGEALPIASAPTAGCVHPWNSMPEWRALAWVAWTLLAWVSLMFIPNSTQSNLCVVRIAFSNLQ